MQICSKCINFAGSWLMEGSIQLVDVAVSIRGGVHQNLVILCIRSTPMQFDKILYTFL